MITPLDIQNKEFKKSFRGYRESEVDKFLDDIIEDYEKIYKDNIELKDKILVLNEQIEHYSNLEKTLQETLVVAQSTAEDVTRAARQKSKIIIEEAELAAKKMIESADKDVKEIQVQYEELKKEIFIFKTRYKSFIEAQLITLDEFYSGIEKDVPDIEKSGDVKDYIGETTDRDLRLEDTGELGTDEDVDDLGA